MIHDTSPYLNRRSGSPSAKFFKFKFYPNEAISRIRAENNTNGYTKKDVLYSCNLIHNRRINAEKTSTNINKIR